MHFGNNAIVLVLVSGPNDLPLALAKKFDPNIAGLIKP
jgi:hypothetical protein